MVVVVLVYFCQRQCHFLTSSLLSGWNVHRYFERYAIPAGLVVAGLGAAAFAGIGDLGVAAGTVGVASAVCCIAAIAGLAEQESARTGNILGMTGVGFGPFLVLLILCFL